MKKKDRYAPVNAPFGFLYVMLAKKTRGKIKPLCVHREQMCNNVCVCVCAWE